MGADYIKLNYKIFIETNDKDKTRVVIPSLENFYYYVNNIQEILDIQMSNKSNEQLIKLVQPIKFIIVEISDKSQLADTF